MQVSWSENKRVKLERRILTLLSLHPQLYSAARSPSTHYRLQLLFKPLVMDSGLQTKRKAQDAAEESEPQEENDDAANSDIEVSLVVLLHTAIYPDLG